MTQMETAVDARGGDLVSRAVNQSHPLSRAGLLERAFTAAFSGLVYPQIWEDPEVDLEGLALVPGARVLTISSGGCNALSYLTADPGAVIAVDLNPHHIHLARLKQAALCHSPNHQTYYRLIGLANDPANPALYRRHLRDRLAPETRAYWDGRDALMRRRIGRLARGLYREGLLGRFIWLSHLAARVLGLRMEPLLEMPGTAEQRAYFDSAIAPVFEHWLVQRVTRMKASLFGLGIPPAQYDKLALEGGGDMAVVLRRRLEKLACDFPVTENYFAWQAFGRRYAPGDGGPLPLYLQARHFETLKGRAERVEFINASLTDRLAAEPPGSLDAIVLLDAQDWMTDAQLNDLWRAIGRAARPDARVLFRTADLASLLPGRLDPTLLAQWHYEGERSAALTAKDRSAVYGGVHLYRRAA
ncbi:MAG: DUF3419 family protein [Pseudomonadota bacterium]